MKVYVVKRNDGKYLYLTDNYHEEWIDDLYFAYKAYEFEGWGYEKIKEWIAKKYPNCKLVPITIFEGELADYTKQVRKEACEEIRNKIDQAKMIYEWKGEEITIEDILDQIQGE